MWLNSRDFLDSAFYVGLILTAEPSDTRWWQPHVHAWVVRRGGGDVAICEPAKVERP
jgi:hypothetical protein